VYGLAAARLPDGSPSRIRSGRLDEALRLKPQLRFPGAQLIPTSRNLAGGSAIHRIAVCTRNPGNESGELDRRFSPRSNPRVADASNLDGNQDAEFLTGGKGPAHEARPSSRPWLLGGHHGLSPLPQGLT